jgi:hypothetical protein
VPPLFNIIEVPLNKIVGVPSNTKTNILPATTVPKEEIDPDDPVIWRKFPVALARLTTVEATMLGARDKLRGIFSKKTLFFDTRIAIVRKIYCAYFSKTRNSFLSFP